ncbi:MAG: methyl-accepting chemotaxis protein [Melioribacteraceae bacterium]|nr:methyl-accepting chemotaxis protein [Melioribacteraceae bacterium]
MKTNLFAFNKKLGVKLAFGFSSLISITVAIVIITEVQLYELKIIENQIQQLRTPTVQGSMTALNGVNQSLAGLRGYMLLENDIFKTERQDAWSKLITPSLEKLESFSNNWTNPENIKRLSELKVLFKDFNKFQKEIEVITHTNGNLAKQWLGTKAAPTANKIKIILTNMIKDQQNLANTDLERLNENISFLDFLLWVLLAIGVAVGISLTFLFTRAIVKPIKELTELAKAMAEGDLTQHIESKSQDEIGVLAQAMNTFSKNIHAIIKNLQGQSNDIGEFSIQLSDVSKQLTLKSDALNENSNNVATATEEVSINSNTMAATAEEMSINAANVSVGAKEMADSANAIASAAEEMSSSVEDVSNNARNATDVTEKASEMSTKATTTMHTLGIAADEIGKVTEVIKRIAEQTNLLALNATIEAASAGEAGKGFAVVANEIKELANQSAQAAEDIANKIDGVQANTKEAITVIDEVSSIIKEVNESVSSISKAVEQQAIVSNEIATNISNSQTNIQSVTSNIGEVAQGSQDMAKSTSEAAEAATDVAQNIGEVSSATESIREDAQTVESASVHLKDVVVELSSIINNFQTK